jgi:hypothetical protein
MQEENALCFYGIKTNANGYMNDGAERKMNERAKKDELISSDARGEQK